MQRTLTSGLIATACAAALLLGAAPAGAAISTVEMQGAPGPGPLEYNRVFVTKVGPPSADHVLVLIPGTIGGAGDFTQVAEDIVARVPNLQVWAIDRRTQAFEDTSLFAQALNGQATADQAFDYYLRWLIDSSIQPHYQPLEPSSVPFVQQWGLEVELNDVRQVVRAASKGGREVVLGGHSLGASSAAAYATWDFNGRPGYRDVEGIVLIDGGLLGTFDSFNAEQAQAELDKLPSQPFLDLLGLGLPWVAGIFAETGGLYAKLDPTGVSTAQQFPLLPPQFNPGFPVTNRALLGYAFDESTSPAELALIHVRAGQLAASGDPRDWQDGEVTPIARLANTFAQEPANGIEWYFPYRLTIDVNGADRLKKNAVTRLLGLRTFHTAEVDTPLYAFQTSLTGGDVIRGAKRFVKRSEVRPGEAKLVDGSATTSHLDPLTAAPETNKFLDTVVPFLKDAFK